MNQRIEQAWTRTQDWITKYDGAATEAYLQHVPATVLDTTLLSLQRSMFTPSHNILDTSGSFRLAQIFQRDPT
jgi:hypothetical protein